MGNASRKTGAVAPATEAEEDSEVYLDPRSPTPDVARTPITGGDGVKHKITKKTDLTKTLETCQKEEMLIHNNPILSAVIRSHLTFDPRSPTQDFERTPVILAPNNMKNALRDHNGSISFEGDGDAKSYDTGGGIAAVPKYFEEFLDATLDSTFRDSEPLGSSTASQDAIEDDASPTRQKVLLETNFDFAPSEPSEDRNINPKLLKARTVENVTNALLNRITIMEADPRSPSAGIDRTPIILPQKIAASPNEDVEDMSEESLVAALQNGIADFRGTPAGPADVGLLIYEDDTTEAGVTTRKAKSATKSVRTPLSCMKNKKEERAKSDATIVEAKKKSRIPKRVGSVARVQSLQRAMTVELEKREEHENTPPNSKRDVWDKESSVVL